MGGLGGPLTRRTGTSAGQRLAGLVIAARAMALGLNAGSPDRLLGHIFPSLPMGAYLDQAPGDRRALR